MNALALDPNALRTQSLFASFTDRQLTYMVSAVKHRSCAAGTCILRTGDTPDGLYVLLSCPASVQAVERCELAFVPKKTFLECIYDNAPAAVFVLQKALERLSAAHEKM